MGVIVACISNGDRVGDTACSLLLVDRNAVKVCFCVACLIAFGEPYVILTRYPDNLPDSLTRTPSLSLVDCPVILI